MYLPFLFLHIYMFYWILKLHKTYFGEDDYMHKECLDIEVNF
jgi:hypothetical protein